VASFGRSVIARVRLADRVVDAVLLRVHPAEEDPRARVLRHFAQVVLAVFDEAQADIARGVVFPSAPSAFMIGM
jgi:hypothetical protein